jgi:hypothetical protein
MLKILQALTYCVGFPPFIDCSAFEPSHEVHHSDLSTSANMAERTRHTNSKDKPFEQDLDAEQV